MDLDRYVEYSAVFGAVTPTTEPLDVDLVFRIVAVVVVRRNVLRRVLLTALLTPVRANQFSGRQGTVDGVARSALIGCH